MKTMLCLFALVFGLSIHGAECSARARFDQMRNDLGKKCDHTNDRLNCLDVLKVTDGDTISVNIIGIHPYFADDTDIRLFGLDTPESRPSSVKCIPTVGGDSDFDRNEYEICLEAARLRDCEKAAAEESAALLENAICEESDRVDVKFARDNDGQIIREKFGRILGDVLIYDYSGSSRSPKVTNVGDILLKDKLAFPYNGGTKVKRDWCNKQVVTNPKLQDSYIRENFCSSRKCTEKTYQNRCAGRRTFSAQMNCYEDHIAGKISRWFSSCQNKSGAARRECYADKSDDYFSFCDEYDSTNDVRKCRVSLSKTINKYCTNELDGRASSDCSLALD